MTNTEQIHAIADRLAEDGKKPTVALVKTQLTSSVPLPQIISALKCWSYTPEKKEENDEASNESVVASQASTSVTNDLETTIANAVAKAVAPLQQELREIKELLKSK